MASKQLVSQTMMVIFLFMMMNYVSPSRFVIKDAALIDTVCQKTSDPNFCKSTLNSDSRSASADLNGLADIVLQQAEVKALEILARIQRLTKEATDPRIQNGLFACNQLYGPARDKISAAILDLTRDATRAASLASGAALDPVTCEASFRPSPSPLTNENNVFASLAKTASEIINEMVNKKKNHHSHILSTCNQLR
ncbi:hypothetical protein LIER_19768 [Lithospermum erythrorhizon]|uniref:Pectinesterase inhibitor domain-containing protein n=1 Tax=Lithospermum erythrorhizon TaxID=34254 RepID=A0AAV3QLZ1_LITER